MWSQVFTLICRLLCRLPPPNPALSRAAFSPCRMAKMLLIGCPSAGIQEGLVVRAEAVGRSNGHVRG